MSIRRSVGERLFQATVGVSFVAGAALCCLAFVAAQERPGLRPIGARPLRPGAGPATAPPVERTPNERVIFAPPSAPDSAKEPAAGGKEAEPPLFEGWPKPTFALLLTGNQSGYIEPCGCTGLANQKGGLARKYTLAEEIRERGWPLVPLDVGAQVRRFGRQQEIKFQSTVEALEKMKYGAVGFGFEDLRLDSGELIAGAATIDPSDPNPYVCANVYLIDRLFVPEFRVIEAGGKKIGVTAMVGESFGSQLRGGDVVFEPPGPAVKKALAELQRQRCDLYVLLAHATLDESRAAATAIPGFDVVLTSGGGGEPEFEPTRLNDGKTWLVQAGVKGMYAGVIGYFAGQEPRLRYERIALSDRFSDAPEMRKLMAAYQDQLQNAGLDGLGLRPSPYPDGRKFVGSAACADCHTTAYEIWEKSPHAHATDSIVRPTERSDIPRHYDPECLSCHVTGWNPQNYYPYATGYLSLEETPDLKQQGCENCHGPGAAHVAAESGDVEATDERKVELREAMRLPLDRARQKCLECHDLDNSPDFHEDGAFERYWKQIEHKGKD